MDDAKRVDLDMLRRLTQYAKGFDRDVLADAIAEIESARAAPPPSFADAVAALPGACMDLATHILDRVDRVRHIGPSQAARLYGYRCAVLSGMLDGYAGQSGERFALDVAVAEKIAHAMLAAEGDAMPVPVDATKLSLLRGLARGAQPGTVLADVLTWAVAVIAREPQS